MKKFTLKREAQAHKTPETLGEEVEALMREWYEWKGLTMPPEEIGIGAIIDAEERKRHEEEMNEYSGILKKQEEAPAGEKPEFGTPEFWAWARKRKKEKDAEREKQGLPPLPTKKEKEELKAKKAAEKAEKAKKKTASVDEITEKMAEATIAPKKIVKLVRS
jgi:hypothetical protein